jgi:hypothetical protein
MADVTTLKTLAEGFPKADGYELLIERILQ